MIKIWLENKIKNDMIYMALKYFLKLTQLKAERFSC